MRPVPVKSYIFLVRRLIACCLALAAFSSLQSQSLRVISTRDGLPQSFVSGLVQDDSSFMWIGTRNGVARFDGVGYKIFQQVPDDSSSISSNLVIWLEKDAHNRIWIEHETGEIDGLDPVTEHVTHLLTGNRRGGSGIRFARRGWLVDHSGLFWGMTGEMINSFDPHTGKINRFDRAYLHASADTLRGLTETASGQLWTVSQQSISVFDQASRDFRHYTIPYRQDFGCGEVSGGVAMGVHERRNGELMWGDRSNLIFFNPQTKGFRMQPLPRRSFHGVDWVRTGPDGSEYFEHDGRIYRYAEKTGAASITEVIPGNFGIVESFYVDRSGLIWVGTDGAGIKQVDLTTPYFTSYAYRKDFGVDIMDRLFGIKLFEQFHLPLQDTQYISPGYQLRWAYDHRHRLHLALSSSVCYFDSLSRKWVRLTELPSGMVVAGISFLRDDRPLVITVSGDLMVYDAKRKDWTGLFTDLSIHRRLPDQVFPEDIYADDKYVWITTVSDGLLRVALDSGTLVQLLKPDSAKGGRPVELVKVCPDPRQQDILWIGSYSGLIRLDTRTLGVTRLSLKDGLPDNVVYSLAADRSGELWFGTNKGLCQMDQVSGHIRVFRTQHGLPGDEFNRFHFMVLPDGHLVFGGVEGWTVFDPLLMKKDEFEPQVALTDLKINNKDIFPSSDPKGILNTPLNAATPIDLPYDQNTIAIGYAGLEFSQPHETGYRYRLVGYENDWVLAGASRQAVYTKLPPGDYVFEVNASNTSGIWSSHVKSLMVHVAAPWWMTTQARVVYILLVAALVLLLIRMRDRRMELRREMEWKEKERLRLKELDDLKTRFFANITHEFRTPLTLIMGPAERLQSMHPAEAEENKLSGVIQKNATQLLTLVNRLLDLSRLEGHAFPMNARMGSPGILVKGLVAAFELEAVSRGISLTLDEDSYGQECLYFPDALERIVYNLLSNALKFTPIEGKIRLQLSMTSETLRLDVSDNGVGIPEELLPHIFDRFFQAGQTGGQKRPEEKGSGIGLSMVKEIVELVKGSIKVESAEAKGTRFTILMPVQTVTANGHATLDGTGKVEQEDGQLRNGKNERESGVKRGGGDERGKGFERIAGLGWTGGGEMDRVVGRNSEARELKTGGGFDEELFSKPRVLLVEDNREVARFIGDILSRSYEIVQAFNGAEGLEQAVATMPDLVISDVMMPVMDGNEFCALLRADIRTNHIPVILLTAKTTQDDVLEGLVSGATDYLTKPFHPEELQLRVRNVLERQRRWRERVRRELSTPELVVEYDHEAPTGLSNQTIIVEDPFLTRLYEQIDLQLDNPDFGVDQLVTVMNISRSSLHRKLKAITGLTTTEVVRNYRLKIAAELLRQGSNSQEAAYKTGFGSPAYFSKCFREAFGQTPSDYIRSCNGASS